MATYTPQQLAEFFKSTAGGRTDISPTEMDSIGWGASPREMYEALRAAGFPANGGTGASTSSASSASGGTDPAGLAAIFRQPDVTLPGAEDAKLGLRDLQTTGVGGLKSLIGQDTSARRKALEDAYYDRAAADIDYSADRSLRDGLEGTFGRNVGVSSISGDYVIEPLERARLMAKNNARQTAFTTAGQDVRAETDSQAQLLGQAFNQGTTGLQGEANVEASNRAANQSATQAGYNTGIQTQENAANRAQQESQFGRSLAQTKELQDKAFTNSQTLADKAATAGAIGGGIGGLAQLFAPAANNLLSKSFDLFKPVNA